MRIYDHSQCNLALVTQRILPKKEVLQRLILTYPGLTAVYVDLPITMEICKRAGLALVKQEVCTIFRQVDSFRKGTIKLTKLLKFIVDL